ncbi:MAG: beta-lactamase family protein [Gammaproteobacteria bacterium]|nr:beta-lactamase family protein [Gammaproteobacteria bacterium]
MKKNDIVGLSIALIDDQKIIWSAGFGYADEKKKIKATSDTIYRVGSITKLFTATAIMQLAEQGKLDIDQPLQHYLPQFSIKSRFKDSKPITPRMLMTHHSGLPSDRINRMWGDKTAHFTDIVTLLKDDNVATPPNTIFSYSNLGFTLLGHLVEEISGTPYSDYIEQRILRPAGMKHAYIDANLRNDEHSSKGYFKKKEYATPHLRDTPAGSLNSSVVDLANFARMLFANGDNNGAQIIKPETLMKMQKYQDGDAPFDLQKFIGLSWILSDRFGNEAGLMASHNGGTLMFKSELLTLPKHKLAVVVLANSNTASEVVSDIAEKALKLALESKTGITTPLSSKLKQTSPTLAEDLERLPGVWSSEMGLLKIDRHNNQLKVKLNNKKLDLVRREDGFYHLQYKLLGLLPVDLKELGKPGFGYMKIEGREVIVVYIDGQPFSVVAEKASPQPLSSIWEQRLGHYESLNAKGNVLLESVDLIYNEGLLQAESKIKVVPGDEATATTILLPVSENKAVIHGLGRNKGDTVHFFERDGESQVSYSGFLLRKVK